MPHLPFHQEQLQFVIQLAQSRLDFLDPLFLFLNYFDSPYFFFILIPTIWMGYSYKWGLRIYYWFALNNLVNSSIKTIVGWPRPVADVPDIAMFHPPSNGFPSGGAQATILLGGILIYYWRTPLAWIIGLTYILLISFSRLYLGVHYPIDILGGWLFGFLILFLFIKLKDPLENWLSRQGSAVTLFLSLAIPLTIIAIYPKPTIIYFMGAAIGIGLGTHISLKNHLFLPPPKSIGEGINRSVLAVAMLFLFIFLMPGDQNIAKSFTAGLFMSLAASPICKWFIIRN